MRNADLFLELYKNLEELLEVKYSDGKKLVGSAVMRYYNDDESKKWREELNICREMRNMLSHHAKIGGKPVFEPSDEIIEVLRRILNDVKNPPVSMSIATRASKLTTCILDDLAENVIHKMKENGYSHVPVMENGKLIGVFSVGTVFSMIEKYGVDGVRKNSRIRDFEEFLPVENHTTESFGFVSDSAPFSGLKHRFTAKGPHERRVAALFVTANGNKNEKLLGMITPWDMIKGK
ncbi:MAG: CBS domain-containing protein [Ruminococcaceae bacterium]|nr:CBS domain-containing protein [Oscillospiraceae bacterium]